MKKSLIISAITIFGSSIIFGQKLSNNEVPALVQKNFKKDFATATKVKWEKEKGNYEVNFGMGKSEISALYNSKGEKLETETEIAQNELPATVKSYVTKNKLGKIKEAAKIQKADGTIEYEAEIAGKDYIFDQNGKFLKSQKD